MFSDSEIVAPILTKNGYATTKNQEEADVVLLNTCSIRDNAEARVRNRLNDFKKKKQNNPISLLVCWMHGRANENTIARRGEIGRSYRWT